MQLQKYDLILKKNGKSPISKLIHFFTKDIYNHAELYLGNYIICDAMPNGVKIRTFDSSLKEFDVYRYTGTITSDQHKKIEEFIQKSINSKYDFLQLILQIFNLDFGHPKKYICIELVLEAFRYAGIPVGTWKKGFEQVTKSNLFKKVD